jgi:hypothetical protein
VAQAHDAVAGDGHEGEDEQPEFPAPDFEFMDAFLD